MAKFIAPGPNAHKKNIIALMRDNARRHRLHEVFSDFCEIAALSISNRVDPLQFKAREARYLQIMRRYEPQEVKRFPRMLGELVNWLECGFADCMGDLFMSLEVGDHWKGQFFTPYHIASLMASLTMNDVVTRVQERGFITVSEPACGAGGMLIAAAEAMQGQGVNYQQSMHATAIDIDATAVHMAYVQLSLLHVPAIVVHGNALTLKECGHWVTPAHVWGGWDRRLRVKHARDGVALAANETEVDQATDVPMSEAEQAPPPDEAAVETIRAYVIDGRIRQLSLFG